MKRVLFFLFVMAISQACYQSKQEKVKDTLVAPTKVQQTDMLARKITPGIPKGFLQRDYTIDSAKHFAYTTILLPNGKRSFILEIDLKQGKSTLVPFSGTYKDLEPMLSPDNSKLLFVSNRPLYAGDTTLDFNLWFSLRTKTGWSEPQAFDSVINTHEDEYYPSMNAKGDLYFTALYTKDGVKDNLYVSTFENSVYQTPEKLSVSKPEMHEFNAWIAPNNNYILFSALGYPNEVGGGDLYIAMRDSSHQFGQPILLNRKVNTTGLDYCPFVYRDTLYFTSKRMDERWLEKKFNYMVEIKMMADSTGIGEQGIYFIPLAAVLPK